MISLETERLNLRPITEADFNAYFKVLGNPEVGAWIGKPNGFTAKEARAAIKRVQDYWTKDGFSALGVELKHEKILIGHCGLIFREEHDAFELLYAIDKPYWGNGYVSEAAKVCIQYGFEKLKLPKIVAYTQPHNLASRRIMEKHGFQYIKDFTHADLPHVFYELENNLK